MSLELPNSNCVDSRWVELLAKADNLAADMEGKTYRQRPNGRWELLTEHQVSVALRKILEKLSYLTDKGETRPVSVTEDNEVKVRKSFDRHCVNASIGARGAAILDVNGTVLDVRTWRPVHEPHLAGCVMSVTGSDSSETFDKFMVETFPDADHIRHAEEAIAWAYLGAEPGVELERFVALIGESRGGKGTLLGLLSPSADKGPSLMGTFSRSASLGEGGFASQNRLGVHLLIEPDFIRPANGSWQADLLKIVANDGEDIQRKFKTAVRNWTNPRLMLAMNFAESAKLADRDQAILRRMVPVVFKKSVAGREDVGLKSRLAQALPGVARRLHEAWQRLKGRGWKFLLPSDSLECIENWKATASGLEPLLECVRTDAPAHTRITLELLWDVYSKRCDFCGIKLTHTLQTFKRQLSTLVGSDRLKRVSGVTFVHGVQPIQIGRGVPEAFKACSETLDGHWCETAHPWRGAFKAVESNLYQTELDI